MLKDRVERSYRKIVSKDRVERSCRKIMSKYHVKISCQKIVSKDHVERLCGKIVIKSFSFYSNACLAYIQKVKELKFDYHGIQEKL